MEDKAVRIFLNTKGKDDTDVSEELVEFLHYIENSTDETAVKSKNERIKRIHERVCKVRLSEAEGVKYMQAWEEKYYEREEGFKEGYKLLIKKKLAKGKTVETIADELEESVEWIEELMKELAEEL